MTRAKKKGISILGRISSRTLMLCAAALLAVSYLSAYINPARAWIMTIFGLLYAPLALLNLVLLLWAILRRSKAALIPFVVLIPSVITLGHYFQFSSGAVPDNGDSIKIVSYNVGRFSSASKNLGMNSPEQCADSIFRHLRELDADIICLQEFYMRDSRKVRAYLQKNFKGYEIEYYVYPNSRGCYGNVTLSRYHINSKNKLDFERSSNLAISCDCKIDGTPLRVYNCHFQSYNISLPYMVKSVKGDYKGVVRYAEDKLKHSIKLRPKQVDMVMENIENCPTDALVIGDFNDNPTSYTYHRLRKGRKDSFVEAGQGFGTSYNALRPLLRLDYILYPSRFGAVSHKVLKWKYSDHYPIIAQINI